MPEKLFYPPPTKGGDRFYKGPQDVEPRLKKEIEEAEAEERNLIAKAANVPFWKRRQANEELQAVYRKKRALLEQLGRIPGKRTPENRPSSNF